MSRRIFSISLMLGFLFIASLLLTKTNALAQAPTPMPTSPAEFVGAPLTGSAPLTVQFTHVGGNGPIVYCVWTFGDGIGQTFSATASGSNPFPACPPVSHAYTVAGKFTPSLTTLTKNGNPQGAKTNFDYVQVAGPTPTATTVNNPVPDLKAFSLFYANSNPPCPNNPRVSIAISAGGAAVTTPFQVTFNGETRTINGIGVNQGVSLDFNGVSGTKTVVIDSTNVIAETNESNNSTTFTVPSPTCGGPSLTPTTGASPTRTATVNPTNSPTPTRTMTPSGPTPVHTRTLTPGSGACSPVTAAITAPFIFDGAGTFCWQASNLGGFINSWNTTSVTLNGVNITNLFVAVGSYPAKINGFWYVRYSSNVAFGHLEAK